MFEIEAEMLKENHKIEIRKEPKTFCVVIQGKPYYNYMLALAKLWELR